MSFINIFLGQRDITRGEKIMNMNIRWHKVREIISLVFKGHYKFERKHSNDNNIFTATHCVIFSPSINSYNYSIINLLSVVAIISKNFNNLCFVMINKAMALCV